MQGMAQQVQCCIPVFCSRPVPACSSATGSEETLGGTNARLARMALQLLPEHLGSTGTVLERPCFSQAFPCPVLPATGSEETLGGLARLAGLGQARLAITFVISLPHSVERSVSLNPCTGMYFQQLVVKKRQVVPMRGWQGWVFLANRCYLLPLCSNQLPEHLGSTGTVSNTCFCLKA